MVSERSLGWLRYLSRKIATADRWGPDDQPHPHWDGRSEPPWRAHRRFDLADPALALGLLAGQTPAWTEPHTALLDGLVERHLTWWGAWDGAPSGGADPLAADGMLSFAAPLLVLLGFRAAVAGDDRWNEPFGIAGGEPAWTHTAVAAHLAERWRAAPDGLPDGTGAVRPELHAMAGLGLRLHDLRHGTDLCRDAFGPWWRRAGRTLVGLGQPDPPSETTVALGADGPVTAPARAALPTAAYLAGLVPDEARLLFEAGCDALDPRPPAPEEARWWAAALLLARDWGLPDRVDALAAAIEAAYQPTADPERGEHTWGLGLGEAHPRGQANAWLAAAGATTAGSWSALCSARPKREHQVVGVDFPTVALRRAEWVNDCLLVALAPVHEVPNRWTTFRITGAEPRMWYYTGVSGTTMDTAGNATIVRAPLVRGDLEFAPGSY